MLTRRDFQWNFFLWKVISVLQILPVDVDRQHGILKRPFSPWRRWITHGFFGLTVIHGCYIHFRLLQVLLYWNEIPRHHFVFHVDMSLVSLMTQGSYLACFVMYSDTFVALFNDVFTATGGYDDFHEPRKARSRQEWLVLALPTAIFLAIGFILYVFTYDRRMAFLLYSALPPDYKTPLWFGLVLCEEVLFLILLIANASVVLITQLLFFEKVTSSLKILKSSIFNTRMRTEKMAKQAYIQLRTIQLKVGLFNNVNRFIIFSFKFLCITMCTLNGYYMIAHFSADPMYGCVYGIAFWVLCISYSIVYERAYAIPTTVGLIKLTVLARVASRVHVPALKRKIEMELRSVPAMGIQVGRFHTFERVATPVFVDYVVRNVTGLLVMHLKN